MRLRPAPHSVSSMTTAIATSIFATALVSAGCSDSDSPLPTPVDAGVQPDVGFNDSGVTLGDTVDISGTWASYRLSSQCFDGPLGTDRVLFTWISKHTVTQTDTSGQMTTEVCNLAATPYRGSVTTYPPEAIAALDAADTNITLGMANVGASFVTAPQPILLGWQPTGDAITESLPPDDMDPRLVDSDNDSNPGVTLNIMSLVAGDVYIANRALVTLNGTIATADRISGTNETEAAQIIVGATNPLLNNNSTVVTQDPLSDSSPFEIVRLTADLSCADIVADAMTLFTIAGTTPPTDCP